MHLSPSASIITIGLLLACATSSAEDQSASSSQRYRIHVPKEVKFGQLQPAAVSEPTEQPAKKDTESLVFMAETTSGLTIQFESQSEPARKQPLKLSVAGGQRGSWWASKAHTLVEATGESVAEATVVQATTLNAGWATLQIDVTDSPASSDATMTTIVVTIVAH